MSRVDVYQGDSREILRVLPDASVDAVVTDPPYALVSIGARYGGASAKPTTADVYARATAGFMGRGWDTGETAFAVEFWAEVWRVLKPGGHVVAFSGTRTYHRLAVAVEDAGFEIRDMVAWLYGSGFPKSTDVAKAVDKSLGEEGRRTATGGEVQRIAPGAAQHRNGWEKSTERTFTPHDYAPATEDAEAWRGWGSALKPALEPVVLARKPLIATLARNVLAHGTGALNVDGCRVGDEALPAVIRGISQIGTFEGAEGNTTGERIGRWPANVVHDGSDEVVAAFPHSVGQKAQVTGQEPSAATGDLWNPRQRTGSPPPRGDAGSAARFFYSAKADTEDRLGSDHPTVKPVDLMAWLVRLVCRPGGVVLDPFAGSGTTGLAAMREGCDAILIEREEDHADDIRRRMAWARGEGGLTAQEVLRRKLAEDPGKAMGADLPLFGEPRDE